MENTCHDFVQDEANANVAEESMDVPDLIGKNMHAMAISIESENGWDSHNLNEVVISKEKDTDRLEEPHTLSSLKEDEATLESSNEVKDQTLRDENAQPVACDPTHAPNTQGSNSSHISVLSFCVPVPNSLDQLHSVFEDTIPEDRHADVVPALEKCVVGTITVMDKSSAMIWLGWGTAANEQQILGRSLDTLPMMGPTVIAMPRIKYSGMSPFESPCSQLIGSDNEDDQMIGWQMASRLSQKLQWPIVLSCSLVATDMGGMMSGTGGEDGFGIGVNLLAHRAAALGEKEIGRLLLSIKNNS